MTRRVLAGVALLAACSEGVPGPTYVVAGGDSARGREAIVTYACGTCHVIPGVPGAEGLAAPPLVYWSERAYIAGRAPNQPENLVQWLVSPQSIDSGTTMPSLGLTDSTARDIAAYLYTVGDVRSLGPPSLLPRRWLHGF